MKTPRALCVIGTWKAIALNVLLVGSLAAIIWQGRMRWSEAQAKREHYIDVDATSIVPPTFRPTPIPGTVPAMKYAEVVTNDIFSKDRNPTAFIDPPKVEAPKQMPPLPVVYGVLGLPSGTKAIISEKAGLASRPVHAGDTIGEFWIASLDPQNVTFVWDGKIISRKVEDLIDRSGPSGPAGVQSTPVQSTGLFARSPMPGNSGSNERSQIPCVPGDDSPLGTIVGRYKRSSESTARGPVCSWVRVW